ncbi:MAG: hypothetical protein V5A66_05000 [Candidatus Thermoplasmatota archaeon]
MDTKKKVFIATLVLSIIFLSLLIIYFGGYYPYSGGRDNSIRPRDYWWLFAVLPVIIIILFDKTFWREEDIRKVPSEGRLIELQTELDQEEPRETEDEYKL